MAKVTAIKCKYCRDTIFSRARHDFRACSCEKTSIDGGFEYVRIGWPGEDEPVPEQFTLEIEASPKDMYLDWNAQTDKLGLIKNRKVTKFIKFWNKRDKQRCPECDEKLILINNLYYCKYCNLDVVFKVKLRG